MSRATSLYTLSLASLISAAYLQMCGVICAWCDAPAPALRYEHLVPAATSTDITVLREYELPDTIEM